MAWNGSVVRGEASASAGRTLAIFLLIASSCTLPFVAKTSQRSLTSEGVRVTIGEQLGVWHDRVSFELHIENDSDDVLVIPNDGVIVDEDGSQLRAELLDARAKGATIVVDPRREVRRSFVVFAREAARLTVLVKNALLGERPFAAEALELVTPDAPLSASRAANPHLRLRALGGALITRTPGSPLERSVTTVGNFLGVIEVVFGFSWGRLEANLLARGGNGRLVGFEAGVRPGPEWLTVFLGYGLDMVQVSQGIVGERDLLFGHGPRLTTDFAFDLRQVRLGVTAPRRFGAFVSLGASSLAGPLTRPHWVGVVEAGLRWQLF